MSGRLVLCAVAVEFSVSANLLTWIGVPYVVEGGALPFKIHPGTYMICAAFLLGCAGQTRSNGVARRALGRGWLVAIYLGAIAVCLVYAMLMTGKGNLIVLIDTFLPAGLLAAILETASQRDLGALRRLLQWGVAANAVLALSEAATHASLVPLYLNNAEFHPPTQEFRPTALYDHPLTGGVMTMIGFALPPERLWPRVAYICLLAGAMIAFGGRVAVAAVVISWGVLGCINLGRLVLQRDRRAVQLLISSCIIAVSSVACLLAVLHAGLGTRLAIHLYWDPSAQVRLAQWHLLSELSLSQLGFGTARNDLLALLDPLWLSYGVEVIENFWLLMFASLGAAGFAIFLVGFVSLLCWCWRSTNLRGRVLLVSVVLVASASNSLGRKSTLLVGLVAAIACIPIRRDAVLHAALGRVRPGSARGALFHAP